MKLKLEEVIENVREELLCYEGAEKIADRWAKEFLEWAEKNKGKKENKNAPVPAPAAAPAPVAEPAPVIEESADDGELAAVITAAIAAMLDSEEYKNEFVGGFRVVSFKRSEKTAWNRK